MSDETDDETIEPLPATPAADLAFLTALLTTINSARQVERRVKELRRETAAAEKAKQELSAARAAFDQETEKARAELVADRAAVDRRRLEVHQAEGLLEQRDKLIADLETQWEFVGETDPLVFSGMREPQGGTALQKARRAAGIDPPLDDDEPAVERKLSREVGGTPFPVNTTITADVAVHAQPARSQRSSQ